MIKLVIDALKLIVIGVVGIVTFAVFLSLVVAVMIFTGLFISALVNGTCTVVLTIAGIISILIILFGAGLHIREM